MDQYPSREARVPNAAVADRLLYRLPPFVRRALTSRTYLHFFLNASVNIGIMVSFCGLLDSLIKKEVRGPFY